MAGGGRKTPHGLPVPGPVGCEAHAKAACHGPPAVPSLAGQGGLWPELLVSQTAGKGWGQVYPRGREELGGASVGVRFDWLVFGRLRFRGFCFLMTAVEIYPKANLIFFFF